MSLDKTQPNQARTTNKSAAHAFEERVIGRLCPFILSGRICGTSLGDYRLTIPGIGSDLFS